MYCKVSIFLAYSMTIYTISSFYYYLRTRTVGTPFKNSLTQEQIEIKKKSAQVRRNIFYQGVVLGAVLLLLFQPFQKC
tara:strand:+ start:3372 stop:3605 length:234 start_codon:yes stop_codon:yes gene_type:complete